MELIPCLNYAFVMILLMSLHNGECFMTHILDLVSGDIQGGNFSYFSLQHPGLLALELISHSGDCDIYVSQFKSKPTFELGSYCSESTSCGLDKIIIPKSFRRPLAIGIYGHPSYEISKYTLNIYQISDTSDADNESDELYLTTKYADFQVHEDKNNSYDQTLFPYIIYFLSTIWNGIEELWSHLRYVENEYMSFVHPMLDIIIAVFGG